MKEFPRKAWLLCKGLKEEGRGLSRKNGQNPEERVRVGKMHGVIQLDTLKGIVLS